MSLSNAIERVHQQWQSHEPIALEGSARQVFDFLRLVPTVMYPLLGEDGIKEIEDEHSN